ncbi:MAG: phosphate butyryltransferase [candidate division Zixibacteria bacterium]|nr:phosphate butyryltransferase [candidate division Zixibacteria bacterium]
MPSEITIPEIHSFEQIHALARLKARKTCRRGALVVPSQIDSLRAFLRASADDLLRPVIVGDEKLLRTNAEKHDLDLADIEILNIKEPDKAVQTAALMAARGEIDFMVQGRVTGETLLSLLLQRQMQFRLPGKRLSHVAVMQPQRYPKLLLLTDGAVTPRPDLATKASLVGNVVSVANAIGMADPRLAAVCAVEVVYPQMPATVEAAALTLMSDRNQIKGAIVEGPLSFDVAVDMEAAHAKGIYDSQVAGQADGFVVSSIEVAQGVYTAMSLYGECPIGGVVVGGRVPVALNATVDSPEDRYNSIALATLV